jgi:uncharacterized protein (DUF1778 family)
MATKVKRERLEARVSPEQKALFEHAAALQGQSLTDFLVQSAQSAAEVVIREHEIIHLTARDSAVLAEALLNPPEPNDTLRAAAQRYRVLVESREW